MLLALDTSADAVTVAVHDGGAVRAERSAREPRLHAELLAPLVAEVLTEAETAGERLEQVVVGVGPGAFTGLRVGIVTALALAEVWGAPVTGVCSLDGLAVEALDAAAEGDAPDVFGAGLLVVTDARRREVFWARYDVQGHRVEGPALAAPDAVPGRHLPAVGAGASAHAPLFTTVRPPTHVRAAALAIGVLTGRVETLPARPLYLRQPDARPPGAAKSVLPR